MTDPLVLVVDDDLVSRLVVAHMLRGLGCEVVAADDVAPARDLVGTPDLALVISDFEMPGGTGLDLLRHVRAQPGGPPFVIMTGALEHAEPVAEADAHLIKPVSTRELTACLSRVWPGWSPP